MNTEWSKTTKHIAGVGLALFLLYILYISQPVLPLLVIASLTAFLLIPVVNFLRRHLRIPRIAAVLISYFVLLVTLFLAPLLLLPPIIDGLQVIVSIDYQILVINTLQWTEETLLALRQTQIQVLGFPIDLDPLVDPALEVLQNTSFANIMALPSFETVVNSLSSALTITFDLATSVAGTVFAGVLTFILTLLYAIYISLNAHHFVESFLKTVPKAYRPEIAILLSRLRKIWRAYFRGQIILMLTIGIITLIGNTAIGLPGAFTLAVIAGLLELIPNLGPILAAVPAVAVALIQGSSYLDVNNLVFALIVIGFYIAVQQVENTLIVPGVLGEAVELHPLVIMIGVVVGASVGGILGALLAAPVIASGREIISYVYAKILNEEPFPPHPPEKLVGEKPSLLERGVERSKRVAARGAQSTAHFFQKVVDTVWFGIIPLIQRIAQSIASRFYYLDTYLRFVIFTRLRRRRRSIARQLYYLVDLLQFIIFPKVQRKKNELAANRFQHIVDRLRSILFTPTRRSFPTSNDTQPDPSSKEPPLGQNKQES